MKVIITIQDIDPTAERQANVDIQIMRMPGKDEEADGKTPALQLSRHVELKIIDYLNRFSVTDTALEEAARCWH
jgi:hypothetical protein